MDKPVGPSHHLRQVGADRAARVAVAARLLAGAVCGDLRGEREELASRPYRVIRSASRYRPERPHLGQSIRNTSSLPIRSPKMIAPSRGMDCHFNTTLSAKIAISGYMRYRVRPSLVQSGCPSWGVSSLDLGPASPGPFFLLSDHPPEGRWAAELPIRSSGQSPAYKKGPCRGPNSRSRNVPARLLSSFLSSVPS
jgi:hypothetical protein